MRSFFFIGMLMSGMWSACGSKSDFEGTRMSEYDILIDSATIYDGLGLEPYIGQIGIQSDTIAAIGDLSFATGKQIINAKNMAVSPGFINMLSWASETLMHDGKAQSDIYQGVTLEVMGEGWSMGPLNENMKASMRAGMDDHPYPISWTSLGEYLEALEKNGVSVNVASFVGAATIRIYELGYENRSPSPEELVRMEALVDQAMQEGAMGVASALIYAPGNYANTEELIALCKIASSYGGMYATHMRSEGNAIFNALDETFRIANEAGIDTEIYHLKVAGKQNWAKLDRIKYLIDSANSAGLKITTDMYNYTAGATGLDAAMPPWCQEGGYTQWKNRISDPITRKKILAEMEIDAQDWENLYKSCGPDGMITVSFRNKDLRKYIGMTISEISKERGVSPAETLLDLVIEDGSRVGTVYFLMSEENITQKITFPFMSFCSDAGALAPEGLFLESNPHPRAYGSFARLLSKYVREEKVITLPEAIRKMTSLPAENLKLKNRGRLAPGYFADIVIFDPDSIADHATYSKPHQLASGVHYVLVNGQFVLADGKHTGATPGRVVRGPGWKS